MHDRVCARGAREQEDHRVKREIGGEAGTQETSDALKRTCDPASAKNADVPVEEDSGKPPQRLQKTAAACTAAKCASLVGTSACGESGSSSLRRGYPPSCRLLARGNKAPASESVRGRPAVSTLRRTGTCDARPRNRELPRQAPTSAGSSVSRSVQFSSVVLEPRSPPKSPGGTGKKWFTLSSLLHLHG